MTRSFRSFSGITTPRSIIIIVIIIIITITIIVIIVVIVVVVIVVLLFIIYTINVSVVRPRACRVIYYFDTPALERRHQSFGIQRSLQHDQKMHHLGGQGLEDRKMSHCAHF